MFYPVKLNQLPNASELTGSEKMYAEQAGNPVQVSTDSLDSFASKAFSVFENVVDSANSVNTRNDQPSIIEISNGRLLIAYSHFDDDSEDDSPSTIWASISDDRGQTWGTPFQLIGEVDGFGTYIPSFYKRATGEIVCVFFARVQTTPTRLSALYQIVYSEAMAIISGPTEILAPDGYFPIGSDRLFYDELNERLLLPYPKLISGSGSSPESLYEGRLLISDDEGDTWTDGGLSIGLNQTIVGGFGGATEPGIFLNPLTNQPIYYYGTLLGSWYAVQLAPFGNTYTAGTEYNTNLYGQNGFGTIKYWPERGIYLGAKVRLLNNAPLDNTDKTIIDLAASVDGLNWFDVFQVEDIPANGGFFALEPVIYIDNVKDRVIVAYSASYVDPDFYYLKSSVIPSVAISVNFTKSVLNQNFAYQEGVFKIVGTGEIKNNTSGNALKIKRNSNTGNYAIIGFIDENDRRIAYVGLAEDGDDQHLNEVVNPPAESTATSGSKLSLVKRAHIFGKIGSGYKVGILDGKILIASDQHNEVYFNDSANYLSTLTVEGGAKFTSTTQPLRVPMMTEGQRDALSAANATGGILLNTTSGKFQGYNGSGWFDFH